ncbi:MAG: response regulator [Anaerolineae bacterium]|nr:response regulator [Anaerolineae bacterium]
MITCEEFERQLQEALNHLYDPDYQPSDALCAALGCSIQDGALAVQAIILRAIKDLEPPSDTPLTAHTRQAYDLLHNRFVLRLTQEETADRMHISRTSVHRAQRTAVHVLARKLWEKCLAQQMGESEETAEDLNAQASDWHTQMERELAALQASAPHAVSYVEETINSVLKLREALASPPEAHVEVESVQPGLVAAIHPSVLRQILIAAIRRMAHYTSTGPIAIFARLEDGNVKITLTSTVATGDKRPTESDLVRDLLVPPGVQVEAHVNGDRAFLWVGLPSTGKVTVLVVDDNPDMARFYRRSAEKTSYHIVHTGEGQNLFETIAATAPDIIVLDVMLPDIDGWELLTRLHQDPATRSIPVVVCTVVREEELALSLGAACYLPKPVRSREFIEALDRVLAQAPARASRLPANNAATC